MTGSTYLEFDYALNKAMKMLKDDKLKTFGLFVITALNLGLRVNDLRKLTFQQLRQDSISIVEGKTKKKRTLRINDSIRKALTFFDDDVRGAAFTNQKGTPFSSQHINRLLKQHFKGANNGLVSSHSLRKSFGRRIWENDKCSERSLIQLSQLFNHTSTSVTRVYLSIQQEELDDLYMSL